MAESKVLHRDLTELPQTAVNAKGLYITLATGERVLDFCGGAAVSSIGHGNEEVIAAAMDQMKTVTYVHTFTYTTDAAEDLAKFVLEGNPGGLEKAYFVCSGSEAMESAMKLARQYFFESGENQRTYFVSRKQAYHGNTFGAMSVSSNVPRKVPYNGLLMPYTAQVGPAYEYHYKNPGETTQDYVIRLADELDAKFQELGPKNVIAFIAEPVVGATTGCVTAPEGYFKEVRKICDKYGILLILDEVMSGMGRTGTLFAWEQEGIAPDIMTTGKGLGGGYAPIAAIFVNNRVVSKLQNGSGAYVHGHTYQAHPTSAAIALAVQKIIRRDNLLENIKLSQHGVFPRNEIEGNFCRRRVRRRHQGPRSVLGIGIVKNRETKECFPPEAHFGRKVWNATNKRSVNVYLGTGTKDGKEGAHLIFAPSFTVEEEDCLIAVKAVKDAYDEVVTGL